MIIPKRFLSNSNNRKDRIEFKLKCLLASVKTRITIETDELEELIKLKPDNL